MASRPRDAGSQGARDDEHHAAAVRGQLRAIAQAIGGRWSINRDDLSYAARRRDVLIGVAAGTVGALLIASLQIVPQLLGRAVTPPLPAVLTTDLSRPYAGTPAVVVIAIAAIAAYGCYALRGGEPLFGRALLD